MRFRPVAKAAVLVLSAVALASCGGGSNSPSTPSTPPPASQSTITVTASAPTVAYSPREGYTYRLTVHTTITETAGLGANINYARLRLTKGGVEIERSEISSADLIVATGSNRLEARASRTMDLLFDCNAGNATGAILVFNFTDDNRNVLESSFTITF